VDRRTDIYVVFTAPPSDKTWGLVRDTRTSIIDPGPWPDLDEAALYYYYLLDFEENWPGRFSRHPEEPDTIQWFGDRDTNLPEHHQTFQKLIGMHRRQMCHPPSPVQKQIAPYAAILAGLRIRYEQLRDRRRSTHPPSPARPVESSRA